MLFRSSLGNLQLSAVGSHIDVSQGYICVDNDGACNIASPQNGTIYADSFQTSATADLAESFPTSDASIEAGDLVASDSQNSEHVVKSQTQYQQSLLGVVSTNPGITLNSRQANGKPIALSGRVPVKVNTQNGPIKKGDPLTSSSTPGVAMKATQYGRIVGMALEDLPNCPNTQQPNCQIIVFVNPGFYYGDNLAQAAGNNIDYSSLGNSNKIFYNLDGTLKDLYKDQVLTAQQIDRLVEEKVAMKLEEYNSSNNPNAETETTSASQEQLDNLNALLAGTNASVETLKVTGNTNLAQTQVAGTLSQDGTFIIDYGKQLNVLGSTLYLQNDSLAGNLDCHPELDSGSSSCGILLDVGAGKATLDKYGTLVLAGGIKTSSVTITDNKFAGSGIIPAGLTSIFIPTSKVSQASKISITFTSDYKPATRYFVAKKQEGVGFTLQLDLATLNNAEFDWFIINTEP